MATYKVIQDIEAEDKLIGPLSFRQFVYFLVAAFFGYLSFISLAKGAPFLLIVLVPPMLFCLFFAWPWSPDQPTEVWALARIRFLFKPRKRIWDQSGIKEFVTITAPKKIERVYTDGLTQTEVRSRLQALAHTIDSRGWAVKNAYGAGMPTVVVPQETDRLLDFGAMPQEVPNYDITASDDILDEVNNPMASHMTEMINASAQQRRHDLVEKLRASGASTPQTAPAPQWFQRTPASAQPISVEPAQPTVLPPVAPQALAAAPPAPTAVPAPRPKPTTHLKNVSPVADQTQSPAPAQPAQPIQPTATPAPAAKKEPAKPIKQQPDPAILTLAHDNNMDVATLAREAKRAKGDDEEVVISLH